MKAGQKPAAKQAASPAIAVPVSFVACYAAWLKARRGKRPSANQLAFEYRWLDNLLELNTALRAGEWQPARTVSFVVTHPKTREIHAPDFADRVVHHLLVERLEKLYEPVFIHDSYANRKGTHAAVDRLQQFMRSRNGGAKPSCAGVTASHLLPQTAGCASNVSEVRSRNGQGWYLQLDIHNYFNSINRHILYGMLCKRIEQGERHTPRASKSSFPLCKRGIEGDWVETDKSPLPPLFQRGECSGKFQGCSCTPDSEGAQSHPATALPAAHALALRSLCHKLLANKVGELVRDPVAAAKVPPHKRLANAAPGCGLPVGNLTSQFFANVYLNALDQFVKHTLKCKHYVRYVDDFILLADDANQLRIWQAQIEKFLAETLKLKIKDEVIMQPLSQGIDFLGYRVFADHRRVRPRVVAHCREKLRDWEKRNVRALCVENLKTRHSSAGRNPAKISNPRSGQNGAFAANPEINPNPQNCPASRGIFNQLDSGLRRNDGNDALSHLQAMLGSYWGHFAHADSVRLRHALFEEFGWLKQLFDLRADGQLSPRWVLQGTNFTGQVAALKAGWPEARCLIQKGNRWVWLPQPSGAVVRGGVGGFVGGALAPIELSRVNPLPQNPLPQAQFPQNQPTEFDAHAIKRLNASFRRQGIAYVIANQTGWLRHGTRRREVREWFCPNAPVS